MGGVLSPANTSRFTNSAIQYKIKDYSNIGLIKEYSYNGMGGTYNYIINPDGNKIFKLITGVARVSSAGGVVVTYMGRFFEIDLNGVNSTYLVKTSAEDIEYNLIKQDYTAGDQYIIQQESIFIPEGIERIDLLYSSGTDTNLQSIQNDLWYFYFNLMRLDKRISPELLGLNQATFMIKPVA